MQYDVGFTGENIGIGLEGNHYLGRNPNFGSTYNYYDDHDYGYSDRPVSELAKERLSRQNGLDHDNAGNRYPGPQPPVDYSYFTQRDQQQGFKAGLTDKQRDYALLISSNVNYFVLLFVVVIGIIISIINTILIIVYNKKSY